MATDLEQELEKETNEVADNDTDTIIEDNHDFEELALEEEPEEEEESDRPRATGGSLKKMAYRLVKTFNAMQKRLLLAAYRRRILQPGDADKTAQWMELNEQSSQFDWEKVVTRNPENEAIYKRVSKFMKLCDELPLKEDEMQDIAEPLAEVIEKREALQMSPEVALLLAVVIAMIPRLEPLLPGFGSVFKKAKEKIDKAA